MAQWGKDRVFSRGTVTIRVLPNVVTQNCFGPITWDSIIDSLLVLDATGGNFEELLAVVKERFLSRPYRDWLVQEPIAVL